jgi:hypothetical protein
LDIEKISRKRKNMHKQKNVSMVSHKPIIAKIHILRRRRQCVGKKLQKREED